MARHSVSKLAEPGVSKTRGAPEHALLLHLLVSLRPEQWTKNLIVFAGVIFGHQLLRPRAVLLATGAFLIFCLLSSVVYLVNDVVDRDSDRRHPRKALRPVASGRLSTTAALTAAGTIALFSVMAAFWLRPLFGFVAVVYLALLASYSGPLKHIVILDVLTIAIGFVLRAVAGAVVIAVPISHWLLVCTILLALFLGLSKRRYEIVALAGQAVEHRPILEQYSASLLDQMISVVTASTLMAYVFYTISPETEQKFGTQLLGLTIPFPLYGIFRYLYLVHRKDGGGSPSEMLLTDRPLLVCVALWAAAVIVIVYWPALR